jgi:hypothetical protein
MLPLISGKAPGWVSRWMASGNVGAACGKVKRASHNPLRLTQLPKLSIFEVFATPQIEESLRKGF